MVFVRLQPYKQSTLKRSGAEKLKPRFYGPYKIIKKVGEVAYELELPPNSKIHNIFHVSCLKKVLGQKTIVSTELPPLDDEGKLVLIPEEILDTREKRLRNRSIIEHLVKWKGLPLEDATWEGAHILENSNLHCLRTSNIWEGRTCHVPYSNNLKKKTLLRQASSKKVKFQKKRVNLWKPME